jgi:hypothetical protein
LKYCVHKMRPLDVQSFVSLSDWNIVFWAVIKTEQRLADFFFLREREIKARLHSEFLRKISHAEFQNYI